jgi:hypothetical protein
LCCSYHLIPLLECHHNTHILNPSYAEEPRKVKAWVMRSCPTLQLWTAFST